MGDLEYYEALDMKWEIYMASVAGFVERSWLINTVEWMSTMRMKYEESEVIVLGRVKWSQSERYCSARRETQLSNWMYMDIIECWGICVAGGER